MTITTLHKRAVDQFGERLRVVRPEQWTNPTPCAQWTVRDLVSHVVSEDLWTEPLLAGETIEEVGDRFDGDVLGADPLAAYESASAAAVAAVSAAGATGRTVHLSYGDDSGSEYVGQLFADHLIHSWDLARAIGADDRLDPELVAACADWFAQREDAYRAGGAIGPRPSLPPGADQQTVLLAAFGRTSG